MAFKIHDKPVSPITDDIIRDFTSLPKSLGSGYLDLSPESEILFALSAISKRNEMLAAAGNPKTKIMAKKVWESADFYGQNNNRLVIFVEGIGIKWYQFIFSETRLQIAEVDFLFGPDEITQFPKWSNLETTIEKVKIGKLKEEEIVYLIDVLSRTSYSKGVSTQIVGAVRGKIEEMRGSLEQMKALEIWGNVSPINPQGNLCDTGFIYYATDKEIKTIINK